MSLFKNIFAFVLVFTTLLAVSTADVYFAGLTINAAPIWFGKLPFIQFGNITGQLVLYGNTTDARGNIVLCLDTVSKALEPTLMFCAQNQPAAIISIFPPVSATVPEQYLGREMYTDITMPYTQIPDWLRYVPIVSINFEDIPSLFGALGSNQTVTVDGSTRNWWEWFYEGPAGIVYQVVDAVTPGITTAVWILLVVRWYRAGGIKAVFTISIKTFMMACALIACPMRTLYHAIDPTGLRRLLIPQDDFILSTLELMFGVMSFTAFAIFQLQNLYTNDLKVRKFIHNKWTIGGLIVATLGWILYLVVIRVLYAFPDVSPVGSGLASLAIIIIQDILLGACSITYTFAFVVLAKRISELQGSKAILMRVFLIIGPSTLFIWFLFVITAIAVTGYWQQPLVPGVTQILCTFFQTLLELFQAISIWQSEKRGTGGSSKPKTNPTSTHGQTAVSVNATKSTSSDVNSNRTNEADLKGAEETQMEDELSSFNDEEERKEEEEEEEEGNEP